MKTVYAILMTLALILPAAAAADLTGTWNVEVRIADNTGTPIFTFKQEGKTLTGTYKGMLGEFPVKGTVDGQNVRWEFMAEYNGQKFAIVYTGTVESETAIKGKIDFGGQMEGTFVAKKGA